MKSKGFALLGLLISLVILILLLLILNNGVGFKFNSEKNSEYKTRQEQINTKVEELQKQINYSREENNGIQGNC